MSLLIRGVTAHTGLTDKEVAGVIDHADGSVSDGKIASGVGLTDGQLLKLPVATQYQLLKRGAAGWFAEAGKFVELSDAPSSYSGQAGKLIKVKPDETGLLLDLLLSFTDWYAGEAPTDFPWVFEANNPISWDPYFSPIVKNDIGQYIVYAGGYNVQRFYRYNITTKQWQRLADPPAVIFGAISMSPDGSKLAAHGLNGNVLFIYDIDTNSWTSSSTAPQMDTTDVQIQSTVWADNDTVWCQVRAYIGGADYNDCSKYVIATDAYSVAVTLGASYYYTYCSDRNKLWYGSTVGGYAQIHSYIDLSDESTHVGISCTL